MSSEIKRRTLHRICGTCGKSFTTTVESPFVRQINQPDKSQVRMYYCSASCFRSSYKSVIWNGRKAQRKKNLYYDQHREEVLAKAKERYWSDPETARATGRYNRKKQKALQLSADQSDICNKKEDAPGGTETSSKESDLSIKPTVNISEKRTKVKEDIK